MLNEIEKKILIEIVFGNVVTFWCCSLQSRARTASTSLCTIPNRPLVKIILSSVLYLFHIFFKKVLHIFSHVFIFFSYFSYFFHISLFCTLLFEYDDILGMILEQRRLDIWCHLSFPSVEVVTISREAAAAFIFPRAPPRT